jgi:subtilisin-like proprotein convertase family protein
MRKVILILLCLLSLAAAWCFWPAGRLAVVAAKKNSPDSPAAAASASKNIAAGTNTLAHVTNAFPYRLANTRKTIGQLAGEKHAILLDNALIETEAKMDLNIPAHLRAKGEPGAFVVQARGGLDAAFRAALAQAGAQIVSYIPNNAYLVQLNAAGAATLASNQLVQAVLPYDPYFKFQASLLGPAVKQKPLPADTFLTLGLYQAGAAATVAAIQNLGGKILATDRSPFGPIVRVQPPTDWLALAQLPGVQRVEPAHRRVSANDLSRQTLGVAANSTTATNYLNLSGSNVLVEVNDTGIDVNHPDLTGRVFLDAPGSGYDTDGHGTFVAGQIAGSGLESTTVINTNMGSTITNQPGPTASPAQFRGMAPSASLFSVGGIGQHSGVNEIQLADRIDLGGNDTNYFVFGQTDFFIPGPSIYLQGTAGTTNYFYPQYPDWYLQEAPAATNALISNNSWNNDGSADYDLSAASYDAAVRDALPERTGPQPVLFVFSAGNAGNGNNDGGSGDSDSILSPATAKNVITVGALEQQRSITNTYLPLGSTNPVAAWSDWTDSHSQVAAYSSRGNVGIGTEGAFGRFKPDVVAPGTFVVSTRSTTWDQAAYYNPTNYHDKVIADQTIDTNLAGFGGPYTMTVPANAVGINFYVVPNTTSPTPFPSLTILVSATDGQNLDPSDSSTYDFAKTNNTVSIPPDGGAGYLQTVVTAGKVSFAVVDTTNIPVNFDVIEELITTNDTGNYLTVLSNLNNSIGTSPYYYRYESGTSMAAADVSGVLALMQDYFTNTLHTTPSPALLKALLINGARPVGTYGFALTNGLNQEGWGLVNLPNSIPSALTNGAAAAPVFFVDQNPTNVLATGDSMTYNVTVPAASQSVPLRITLAWTDPPGNPAAAIKLVNNLDLVVTNLTTGRVYYGNNFAPSTPPYSIASQTNDAPVWDAINNVENVIIPATLGTNYSITVIGRDVNANAVTTEQTNIVQDFALVVACADDGNTNGISVAVATPAPVPSLAQQITYVAGTNQPYFDQLAGASAPWLSTNGLGFGTNSTYATNALFYLGQTNQWHFYVVTNTTTYTNAAFITFIPNTQSIPREGVFAGSDANSTTPEADLDLLVAGPNDPVAFGLTNLDPVVISNCVSGVNGDQASLTRGGTKFIAYTNSAGGNVYYVGVKCEDQMAGQYGFLAVFSQNPFSTQDANGNVYVNGLNVPQAIPDGNNRYPGLAYVFALAIPSDPSMTIRNVIVTNTVTHQDFGDLLGSLGHDNEYTTLNNHDAFGPVIATNLVYDDSGQGDLPGSMRSDGPGSLRNFQAVQGIGVWLMNQLDDSPGATGTVVNLQMKLEPHRDLTKQPFSVVSVPPQSWYYDYVDVPVGYTNLLVVATNLPPTSVPPILLALQFNAEPTFSNNIAIVGLTNGTPPGNSISYGPPLTPGRYWVGLYNPDTQSHDVLLGAILSFNASAISTVDFASTGPQPLVDDAVNYSYLDVPNTDAIQGISVGLRVDHPRISDLVFHLVSPDGTRYLLMENRGGQSTNGCGATFITTNVFNVAANGTAQPNTNYINTGTTSGTFPITYNFYTAPDQMTIYYGTNVTTNMLIYNTGVTFNAPIGGGGAQNTYPSNILVNYGPTNGVTSTYLTIVMDEFPNNFHDGTNRSDYWTYSAGGVVTNYAYLAFTEDTNLTTTPIKFAQPPFVPQTVFSPVWTDSFEAYTPGVFPPNSFGGGWQVLTSQVEIVTNPPASDGIKLLQLDSGAVSTVLPTVSGAKYLLTYDLGSLATENTNGVTTNANWLAQNYTFTAAATNTTLVLASSSASLNGLTFTNAQTLIFDTNALLDNFVLTQLPADLYYQAEQDLSPLVGTSAAGQWQLEVLDNRAGATNNATLLSWQLEFTFANTNFSIATVGFTNGTGPVTNTLPGGSITWYLITVPTNADFATNSLLFATLPLNLWFSTNVPPTTTNNPGDVLLLGNVTSGNAVLGTNGSPVNAPYTPAYIIPSGTYYLGVQNSNVTTATYAINVTFHLLPAAPLLYTLPATSVADVSATLNAAAIPNGLPTAVYFGYGLTTNYSFYSPSTAITNNLTVTNLVATGVTNLLPGAIYHFQAIGTNALGTNYGGDLTFTNLVDLPTVITAPATNITATTATLEAIVNPGGAATTLYFEYGLATNGLTNFSATLSLTNNLNSTNFWGLGVTNLTPGSVYYFQAVATNSSGTNYGGILSFTNPLAGPLPYAFTAPATLATGPSAQLNGFATPNGSAATAWFEWGTSTGYGVTTPPVALGTNYSVVFVTNQISGLTTNLPYHFRLVVSNAVGVTYGFDQIFDQANVVAWGADFFGQTTPLPPSLTNLVVGLGAGYDFSLAVNNDGTVVAWGDNTFGQTNVPAGLNNAVAVSGGEKSSLALRSDRTVLVWGSNQFHQSNGVPANLTNAVAASSGGYHCLALDVNGNPVAWGLNSSGQTNVPAGLTNVVAVAGGDLHSVALKNDGTVVAWGYNGDGETNVPAGLSNVVAIAAGYYHTLALQSNGTVVAWGYDGDNETDVPGNATNVIAIAAGGYHSLALKADGTIVVWGDNSSGQWLYPTNLSNVVGIVGGGFHSLALSSLFGLNQTNNAPFWTNTVPPVTLFEITNQPATLLITNTATDTNYPKQTLTYQLSGSPSWARIDYYSGVITLSPVEPQGLGVTNVITTVVTDNGYPPLSATNSFNVFVYEINTPPYWPTNVPSQTNYTVIAGNLLTVTNTASDLDLPTNVLTYALSVSGGITNALISPNGIITWTPSSAQASNTYTFTTIVTDTNLYALTNQSLSATNTFTVTVFQPNTPPFWPTNPPTLTLFELTNQPAIALVTNTASSTNFPTQTLTYALLNPPVWASINTNTGVITLSPVEPQGLGTNVITTVATGSGSPPLSATNTFNVLVYEVNTPPYWPTNVPSQTNYIIGVSNLLTVTNTASDLDLPANLLTYTNWVSPATNAPVISTNGIITWTPQSAGTFVITNVVTDYNPWALTNQNLSATNYITVTVTNPTALPTNTITIASIIATNGGFLLRWFAPSNDLFQVQCTTNLAPPDWLTFTNPAWVSYNTNFLANATNAQFNFFDDGSQFPFGPTRFYRLLLLQNTNTLTLPALSNQVVSNSSPFTLTNTATDTATNAVLTYSLLNPPAGASINPSNGIITWPSATPAGLAARFITIVTDNGLPPLTASNKFTVFVSPFPAITNVTVTATNVALQWFAPTNDQFQVQWTTNLAAPVVWTPFPGTITSTSGVFGFVDTNLPMVMKFYELILLP